MTPKTRRSRRCGISALLVFVLGVIPGDMFLDVCLGCVLALQSTNS